MSIFSKYTEEACELPIDQFGFPLVHEDNTKKSEEAKAKYDELKNENMRDHFLIKHRRMNFYSLEKANIQRAMDFYFSTIKLSVDLKAYFSDEQKMS
jgi:hypothetical protein